MKKRSVALLLGLVFAVSLAGCGGTAEPGDEATGETQSTETSETNYDNEYIANAKLILDRFLDDYDISLAPQRWIIGPYDKAGAVLTSTQVTLSSGESQPAVVIFTPIFEAEKMTSSTPHYVMVGSVVYGDDGYCDNINNPAPETESDNAETDPTMGQRNALEKAQTHLRFTSFSESGLIEQLKYEGFTDEEAAYGAANCGADWNEQAAKKAQSYLDFTSFSRQGLIEQLEYEGFTKEQAEYGATAVGY